MLCLPDDFPKPVVVSAVLRVPRVQLAGDPKFFECRLLIPLCFERKTEEEVGGGVIRLQTKHFAVFADPAVEVSAEDECPAKDVMCQGIPRLQTNCLARLCNRIGKVAPGAKGAGKVVMLFGILRHQADRQAIFSDRAIQVTLAGEPPAEVVVCI